MHFLHSLSILVEHHRVLAYMMIFLGIVIEGEIVLVVSGILVRLGILNIYDVFVLASTGSFVKTVLGYSIGYFLKEKFGTNKIFAYIVRRVHYFLPHFKEKPFWSIFFSKFIYGLNHFTIIFAGYIRARFKTYVAAELISSAVWLGLLFSIGYFFSYAALAFSHDLRKVGLFIIFFLFAFSMFQKVISWIVEVSEGDSNIT